ncbi:uncharacterized protein LOC130991268 isoform X2 [Salvia miltiorrhiza]|uniref:uncharacterized protein LOC130991268 isoform X2 n=1 Tax=Salvia miltiorrhiza TaxID=226208 RepID=UPI0025AC2453|nr:uncharacterized protein LOC130991268 isoform X2 [Salvia miltiorrhiza]
MAQFTAGVRLKPLVTGNGMSVGFGAFHRRCRVKCFGGGGFSCSRSGDRKRKLCDSTAHASKSSPPPSSATSNAGGVFDEVLEDEAGFEIDELSGFRGLVLDISYRPVNVVCWKRAICLEFMDKVPHLLQIVKRRKVKRGLSRKNIFQRDNYTCQYCSSTENLTIDHVFPIARGGKWTWENLVAACSRCNCKKGQKTLEEASMKLLKVPKAPKDYELLAIPLTHYAIKMMKRKGLPEEWKQYLSKPYAAP